ncbi:hypothetical protein AtubIFM54640_010368 [Aspergillus tubingensis]|nr:hypothetical protein AtubIFM54640_010368 [Aspergillus tubingensis]GLB14455.1 hypothetical protein AtubIFM61612_001883 [Aspergillus tubingensis]
MKNVRNDFLPADRKIATRDCRLCTKRRIKCDRTIPQCRKCTIRGLGCPGFDAVQLNWNHAMARRGNQSLTRPGLSPKDRETEGYIIKHGTSILHTFVVEASPPIPHPLTDDGLGRRQSSTVLGERLINHFSRHVVSIFSWIDSHKNPWRKIVLPLAQGSISVRLSILNLAAAHLAATSTGTIALRMKQVNFSLRDIALRSLNQEIQRQLDCHAAKPPDQLCLTRILIAAITLCHAELVTRDSTDWTTHLHACRAIVSRYGVCARNETLDPMTQFAIKEIRDVEVFNNVFSFSGSSKVATTAIEFQPWTFTDLINDITAMERHHYGYLIEGRQRPDVNFNIWQAKLEQASTQMSLSDITCLLSQGKTTREGFEALIDTHYYATLIYLHQAFASPTAMMKTVSSTVPILLDRIQKVVMASGDAFSQDLFFPLFIAGTECWGDEDKQRIVEQILLKLLVTTGLWCNHRALDFLRAFWSSSEHHGTGKWIQYGRDSKQQLGHLLVF